MKIIGPGVIYFVKGTTFKGSEGKIYRWEGNGGNRCLLSSHQVLEGPFTGHSRKTSDGGEGDRHTVGPHGPRYLGRCCQAVHEGSRRKCEL